MTGLPVSDITVDVLDISIGIMLNKNERAAAGFTLKINDKFVMMTADASPTVFNQAIKTALQKLFAEFSYDLSVKEFVDPLTLFDNFYQKQLSPKGHALRQAVENLEKRGYKVEVSKEETGEITEAQAKAIQEDLQKNGFPFDYPPQDDYNQIPPNDIPEAMFDTLKTGSTEQPKWKANVQRMQKVSR